MKLLRPALIVALLFFVSAGVAFADDIHVVFDPPDLVPFSLNGDVNIVRSLTPPMSFTWFACSANPDIADFAPALSGETACAEFSNRTMAPITEITFAFDGTTGLPGGDSVSCSNVLGDPHLSSASCGPDGTSFTITFAGGTPVPPATGQMDSLFFIGEDGVSVGDINNLGWEASMPEPSSLTLLASAMGIFGLCLAFAKR